MNRFVFLLAALVGTAAAAQSLPAAGILLDSYAAVVNGKVVTVGDVLSAMPAAHERLSAQYAGRELEEKLAEKFGEVRDKLVESELVLLDFETQGGTLPDRAVEDHVNSVIHDQFQDDRTAFLKALAEQRLTYTEWHKQMKDQLVVQIMRQKEVAAKILITPLDLQAAYDARKLSDYATPERVRLRTLAFAVDDPEHLDKVRKTAERLRQRLLAGDVAFDADASKNAILQDDGEFLDVASLHETLRAALTDLAPGGISAPVEIGGSLYLVQLVERRPAGMRTLEEVAADLEKKLRGDEFDRLNRAWIDSLRAKYYVRLFDVDLFD